VAVISSGTARSRFSLADLGVNVKVLGSVAVAALIAIIVWVTGLTGLRQTSDAADTIANDNVVSIEALSAVRLIFVRTRLDVTNQALSTDAASTKKFGDAFTTDLKTFDTALTAYRNSGPAASTATIDAFAAAWKSYSDIAQTKLIPLGTANRLTAWATIRDGQVLPVVTQGDTLLQQMDQTEQAAAVKNAADAVSAYRNSRNLSALVLVLGLLVAVGVGIVVARSIVRSLARVQDVCMALATGDLTHSTGLTQRDEPGRMGQALDTAVSSLRGTVRTIGESAQALAGAAEQLTATATQIATSAQSTSSQSARVSDAAEQISRSVSTVSAGGEEMGAAIMEISQNAAEAAQVAGEAVRLTEDTSTRMAQLGESSAEIGNIVKVITSIAEQTNLLALNATIEAARAGEAGKGFAVVADEVKQLAQETARATEDIAHRVQTIQADTGGSVDAIHEVSAVITRISEFQTTIASAVEEQSATTAEMNRSVAEAASGTDEISRSIGGVADAATQTSRGADETRAAVSELARMSAQLNNVVSGFRL
jgi:methyl-accepting chemotaxis protein